MKTKQGQRKKKICQLLDYSEFLVQTVFVMYFLVISSDCSINLFIILKMLESRGEFYLMLLVVPTAPLILNAMFCIFSDIFCYLLLSML